MTIIGKYLVSRKHYTLVLLVFGYVKINLKTTFHVEIMKLWLTQNQNSCT